MILSGLILLPFVAGILIFLLRSKTLIRSILISTAVVHFGLTMLSWCVPNVPLMHGWIELDPVGLYFLSIVSLLFLVCAIYSLWYLSKEEKSSDHSDEFPFLSNEPDNVFCSCLLFFLGSMSLVCCSHHFGLMWVGIEATTLASAPLIYFHRRQSSLNATWKYVLICSVGIGLALLGNLLLAVSASKINMVETHLNLATLLGNSKLLQPEWLKTAFIFFLVGYGTKMGLAPFHSWLPDAHSESPSLVSALLSGALLNCAFLGILRAHQVCIATGVGDFSSGLMIFFGLFSMVYAALFIVAQKDFKRMLAYSSVEHMGIIAFGTGLGVAALPATMFHILNHSLTKGFLFIVAGNIIATYKSRSVTDVRGMLGIIPFSAILWIAGILAITGTPPFSVFFSEFNIFKSAISGSRYIEGAIFLSVLAVVFSSMSFAMMKMIYGKSDDGNGSVIHGEEKSLNILPPAVLCILSLILGLYMPEFLRDTLSQVSMCIGGGL